MATISFNPAFDADSLIRTSTNELAGLADHAGILAAVSDPKQEDLKAAYDAACKEIDVLKGRLTLTNDTVKAQNKTISKLQVRLSTFSDEARELERLLRERGAVVTFCLTSHVSFIVCQGAAVHKVDDVRIDALKKRFISTADKDTKARMMLKQLCGAAKESDDEEEEEEEGEGHTLTRTPSGGNDNAYNQLITYCPLQGGVLAKPANSFQALLPQQDVSEDDDEEDDNYIDEGSLFADNVEKVLDPNLKFPNPDLHRRCSISSIQTTQINIPMATSTTARLTSQF